MTAAKTAQPQLLFVDGSFEDLAVEMADYLKSDEAKVLLEKNKNAPKEDVLAKLVASSSGLNTVPEKEFTAASNLMIHLVLQSSDPKKYLPALCANFAKPLNNSPVHGPALSLNALTTVFNLLEPADPIRSRVFFEILKFLKAHALFDSLRPYLEKMDGWVEEWGIDDDFTRKLYETVAEVALESGEEEQAYEFILRALRTFDDGDDVSSEEAQRLSLRALKMSLLSNTHYLFQDLRGFATIQALADSHPVYSQLLEIFAEHDLEDYNDFNEEHEGWVEKEKLDHDKLHRKMRLLTLTSLAAATPSRELEYTRIAKALQIPSEDVERWVIDVIRAGLVEGKLSQQRGMLLIHKVTYRVFSQTQYRELANRVDHWRSTLQNVLGVLRQEQANAKQQREREAQELERKMNGASLGNDRQGGDRRRQQREPREPREPRERNDNDD